MSDDAVLAIDQGTHATRAIVFDSCGRQLAMAQQPVSLQVRSHAEVEQDPGEILASLRSVIARVLADPALEGRRPATAGLATQRSSVVACRRSDGSPLAPLLSWQDRRNPEFIHSLADSAADIAQRTGLRLSPHYGAGKMHWLLQHHPSVRRAHASANLLLGPLACFLLFHLLEGQPALVDDANASRTLLWNIQTRNWDRVLLRQFEIQRSLLPDCRPVCYRYGTLDGYAIPLAAVNGDQTAALYAQGHPPPRTLLVNIGTGAFVLLPVAHPGSRPDGLLAGISMSSAAGCEYYLEGTVNGAGAALEWLQQRFGAIDYRQHLPAWLARIESPCLFINTVGGLGAPWWRPGGEPFFHDAAPGMEEAAVAVLESILFLLQANIERLQDCEPGLQRIRIGGGLSNLDGLCQRLADLSGLVVERPAQHEATARGIAWQAAGCPTDWPAAGAGSSFTPQQDSALQLRYRRFVQILQGL